MHTKFRLPLLLATATIFLLTSCSKTNKQGRLIPGNAMMVLHINGEQLFSKLPWEEIQKAGFMQKAMADSTTPPYVVNIMKDPANSGVDIKSDIAIFAVHDTSGNYFAFEGTVKDAAKFGTFNTMISRGGATQEKDGISYIELGSGAVAWTKEKFAYIGEIPDNSYSRYDRDRDEETMGRRDLYLTAKSLLNLSEGKSLAGNEKFSTLVGNKGDVHLWLNAEELKNMMPAEQMGMMKMMKTDDLYKGVINASTLTFDNGKMTYDVMAYAGKEMTKVFEKYSADAINSDMVKRFPGKDITAMFAFSFKPEGIREIIKATGMEGLVQLGLAFMKSTVSIDDFIKANKGDLFFAVNNISHRTDTIHYGMNGKDFYVDERPEANWIFSASIGDKQAFNKFIRLAQSRMGDDYKSLYDSVHKGPVTAFSTTDKYFAIGTDKQLVDQYLAGANNDYDFMKKVGGYPMAGYVNIQSIIAAMRSAMTARDSSHLEEVDLSSKLWQDAYLTGGKIKDGAFTSTVEVNLVDKNTNSLKQLFDYGAKMQAMQDARRERRIEEYRNKYNGNDTLRFKPVIIAPVEEKPIKKKKRN